MNAEKDKCMVTCTPAPIHCTLPYPVYNLCFGTLNMGSQSLQCHQIALIHHKERTYLVVCVLIYMSHADIYIVVTVDIDHLQSVGDPSPSRVKMSMTSYMVSLLVTS